MENKNNLENSQLEIQLQLLTHPFQPNHIKIVLVFLKINQYFQMVILLNKGIALHLKSMPRINL